MKNLSLRTLNGRCIPPLAIVPKEERRFAMINPMKTASLTALIALTASAAMAQESPKALQDAFESAIVSEDAEAVAALYLEDAHLYSPGGTVEVGREAITASWDAFFAGFDGFSVNLDQKGEHAMSDDSHGAWGLWTMTATPADGGEPVTWNGRFLDISVKTEEGWRYKADHASMLATPEAASED